MTINRWYPDETRGTVSDEDEERIEIFRKRYKKSENSAKRYADAVREYAKWLDSEKDKGLFEAEWWDFDDHLTYLDNNDYSSGTFTVRWCAISQFYQRWNKMAARGDMDIDVPENPYQSEHIDINEYKIGKGNTKKFNALRSADEYHYLKPEEIAQLINGVTKPKLRNEIIIKLMYMTGLRRGETVGIKIGDGTADDDGQMGDINLKECSIQIPGQKSKNRTVYYQDSLNMLLRQWINVNRKAYSKAESSEYLLVGKGSEQITTVRLNTTVKKAATEAGLQSVMYVDSIGREHKLITAHTLRHSYAVESLLNGMDIKTLSNVLGHEKLETTKKYLDIAQDVQADIARTKGAGVSLAQFE